MHDDTDEFSLIDICNQISRFPKFLCVIRQASNIAFKLNILCYSDIFYLTSTINVSKLLYDIYIYNYTLYITDRTIYE